MTVGAKGRMCTMRAKGRNRLGWVGIGIDSLLTVVGIGLVGFTFYVKFNAAFLAPFLDSNTLARQDELEWLLFGTAGAFIVVSIYAAYYTYWGGHMTRKEVQDERQLKKAVYLQLALLILTILVTTYTWTQQDRLKNNLSAGLTKALSKYINDSAIKRSVDLIQSRYHCCGCNSSDDWFQVPWINTTFINLNESDLTNAKYGEFYLPRDVPWSCCNTEANFPCVHRGLNKDYKNHPVPVVYIKSCYNGLLEFWKVNVFEFLEYHSIILVILMYFNTSFTRFLQTSLQSAILNRNYYGPGDAHYIPMSF